MSFRLLVLVVATLLIPGMCPAQDTSLTQDQCVIHPLGKDVTQQLLIGSSQCTFAADNLLLALVQLQQEVQQLQSTAAITAPQPLLNNCNSRDNKPRDCHDLLQAGNNQSGVYQIFPYRCGKRGVGVQVWCELEGVDSGWTVVLARGPADKQVNFNRIWRDYRLGFGDPNTEYWIGNEVLHEMTTTRSQVLRVDLGDWDGAKRYALYHSFLVEDEDSGYRLHLDQYSGDAGDALQEHDNKRFSTKDRDHDNSGTTNCAQVSYGGFWFSSCHMASPTSVLKKKQKSTSGITWRTWYFDYTTLKQVTFKVKPKHCH